MGLITWLVKKKKKPTPAIESPAHNSGMNHSNPILVPQSIKSNVSR